jgi:hypothetical protein
LTRSGGSVRGGAPVRRARPDAPRDPYGIGPVDAWIAPVLALVGLVVVAWATLGILGGDLRIPGVPRPGGNGGSDGGPRTAAPSGVVIVDPRADVPGSIVYVKGGNVWVQSGTEVRQLTTTGRATQPAWSPDGEWIYYIETNDEIGLFPAQGNPRRYAMEVPSLMRVAPDGSSAPEELATGRIRSGEFTWFHWLREPAPRPDGDTIAILSDGPDPTRSNVVVQLFDLASREFSRPDIPENPPLGHQDPAWRPDGELLLLVRNGREGARGAPAIVSWNPDTGRTRPLTGPGYLAPAWSRDRRWVAATKTTNFGTDVVILDARTGAELFRVTDDGRSWSPVWSPVGDAIAFLHEEGGIVDLRMVRLTGRGPNWQVAETINLTEVSGLEATSRPGWFIPAADLPPLPTPQPSGAASGAPSPSAP